MICFENIKRGSACVCIFWNNCLKKSDNSALFWWKSWLNLIWTFKSQESATKATCWSLRGNYVSSCKQMLRIICKFWKKRCETQGPSHCGKKQNLKPNKLLDHLKKDESQPKRKKRISPLMSTMSYSGLCTLMDYR